MKTMSQKDFDRLGKKRGVKVKRKMGAQPKKPESEVEDEVALSGAKAAEAVVPAPALPRTVPEGFVETSNDNDHTHIVPVPVQHAAMSASMAASDKNFATLIQKNTETIEAFRAQLAEKASVVKERVPWRHKIKRKDKLIDEVISTPMEKSA